MKITDIIAQSFDQYILEPLAEIVYGLDRIFGYKPNPVDSENNQYASFVTTTIHRARSSETDKRIII